MREPVKQHDAAELAAGYAAWHRTIEKCGIVIAVACAVWLCVRIAACPPLSGWWMPLAALIGLVISDFMSGFIHWLFDTWGSLDTPIFGRLAIRTFRHHHVDEKAITTHDFIETNGHNITLSSFFSLGGMVVVTPESSTLLDVFVGQTLLCAAFFTAFTSQIHKWAHMDHPPRIVALLQRARLILSPDHHAIHHAPPYNRNYCITVGWMNGPLRAIRFFETLERTITALTGAVPREDDIGKDAAIAVAEELQITPPALDPEETKKAS